MLTLFFVDFFLFQCRRIWFYCWRALARQQPIVYNSENKPKSVGCTVRRHAQSIVFFYIRTFRDACECTWKYYQLKFPGFLEIKDTINEVKYGRRQLLVEVFIKVMNGLAMTLEEDKRFLCVWLLYFADSRMEVPRYRSRPTS